jgi:hypothetical protein
MAAITTARGQEGVDAVEQRVVVERAEDGVAAAVRRDEHPRGLDPDPEPGPQLAVVVDGLGHRLEAVPIDEGEPSPRHGPAR